MLAVCLVIGGAALVPAPRVTAAAPHCRAGGASLRGEKYV
jgi:hypothetical protein